jgi:hypothetical protein
MSGVSDLDSIAEFWTHSKVPISPGAKGFARVIWERWGRNRRPCFESQEALAMQFGVTVRTIRGWERQLARVGLWEKQQRGRGRELMFTAGHRKPASGIEDRTPEALHTTQEARRRNTGSPLPPISRERKEHNRAVDADNSQEPDSEKTDPPPIVDALARAERLGVREPGLGRVRTALASAWGRVRDLREPELMFEQFVAGQIARATTANNPAGAFVFALTRGEAEKMLAKLIKENQHREMRAAETKAYLDEVRSTPINPSPPKMTEMLAADLERRRAPGPLRTDPRPEVVPVRRSAARPPTTPIALRTRLTPSDSNRTRENRIVSPSRST